MSKLEIYAADNTINVLDTQQITQVIGGGGGAPGFPPSSQAEGAAGFPPGR